MSALPPELPTPPPAAPVDRRAVKPSVGWVVLAIVLFLGGPAGCTGAMVVEAFNLFDDFDEFGAYRLPVEGAAVEFDEPVDRVAMYLRGRSGADARLLGEVTLVAPDGEPVPLYLPVGEFSFDHPDGGTVTTVFEFTVDQPGTYRLTAGVDPAGEGTELYVGRELLDAVGPTVALGFALGALSALVGLVLLVVVLVRRRRHRRELTGPPATWGGPAPPPGWVGGAPRPPGPPPWGAAPPGAGVPRPGEIEPPPPAAPPPPPPPAPAPPPQPPSC